MTLDRRGFLVRTGLMLAGGALSSAAGAGPAGASVPGAGGPSPHPQTAGLDDWAAVRDQFSLSRDYIHLGGFLLASHPAPVREAIEQHRRGLDENPVHYLQQEHHFELEVLRAAADYLDADPADIALTDSTTMGLGLLYGGLVLREGQEVLTTQQDYYATQEALRLRAARTGATVRTISLYDRIEAVSEASLVQAITDAITPRTRLVAVTWVHSSTGLKLPIRRIADALGAVNASRDEADRVLLAVDGVHGLGVEDVTMPQLGADFFIAGTHKWLFGPRGTGLVWGQPRAWPVATPTIPTFSGGDTPGAFNTPGGFHSFEHRWALAQAFAFHQAIGKARVAERIHALNRQFKAGLASMRGITLYTPLADELSAGLVCFDVAGLAPRAVVARLRERGIIATVTPYRVAYARVAPGLLNTPDEVDTALRAIRDLT